MKVYCYEQEKREIDRRGTVTVMLQCFVCVCRSGNFLYLLWRSWIVTFLCIRSRLSIKALAKLNNTTNLPIKIWISKLPSLNSIISCVCVSPEQIDGVDGDSPVCELINKHLGKRHHWVWQSKLRGRNKKVENKRGIGVQWLRGKVFVLTRLTTSHSRKLKWRCANGPRIKHPNMDARPIL